MQEIHSVICLISSRESALARSWFLHSASLKSLWVALFHLSTATGSTFVFWLRGPSKVISPSSGFKISGDSYIGIDSLFGCLVLRAFRSRRREHGWLGEGIGSVVAAPFPVTLTMCVTVKANVLNEERMSTFVPTPALLWHSHRTWQRLEDSRNALVVSCGEVQLAARRQRTFEGDAQGPCMSSVQLLSARRRTFEHCTSCCPSRDAAMVVLTKKKKKKSQTPLYHSTKKIFWGSAPMLEATCSLKSAVWRRNRVSPPVSKRQNNHLAPSCRLSLKKLLRPAWPRSERGHHSAVRGLPMNFRDLSWWPPLFFPTQNGWKKSLMIVTLPL